MGEEKPGLDVPAPEMLNVKGEEPAQEPTPSAEAVTKSKKILKRSTYRPSHKATFIGLAVVALVLAINGGVIAWLMNSQQNAAAEQSKDSVTLSAETLDGLGVSRNPIGNLGSELTVGPNATFKGKVVMGSNVSIGGKLEIKGDFSANSAIFAKLQAGETSLQQLNVNNDITASTLNLRKDLKVVGNTTLQGSVTINQLLTVNNNLNVAGNLAVGGVLSARNFQANSLISNTTLTIGGHIIAQGSPPSVTKGGAVGSNGTVSISGSDAAGTIAVNTGTGAGNGLLASVTFRNQYGNLPHVLVTPVGGPFQLYITRSISGFNVYTSSSMGVGGYAVGYMVIQ